MYIKCKQANGLKRWCQIQYITQTDIGMYFFCCCTRWPMLLVWTFNLTFTRVKTLKRFSNTVTSTLLYKVWKEQGKGRISIYRPLLFEVTIHHQRLTVLGKSSTGVSSGNHLILKKKRVWLLCAHAYVSHKQLGYTFLCV